MVVLFSVLLSACCRNEIAPILDSPQERSVSETEVWTAPLEDIVIDSTLEMEALSIDVQSSNSMVEATISDGWITLTPTEQPFNGDTTVTVTVNDQCEQQSIEVFDVTFGTGSPQEGSCVQQFSYQAPLNTTAVYIAGEFNDWNDSSHPLVDSGNGLWTVDIELDAPTAYKFVVEHNGQTDWTCDPTGDWFQCDAGQDFANDCTVGASSCNSIAALDCNNANIELLNWNIVGNQLELSLSTAGDIEEVLIEYNGITERVEWNTLILLPLQDAKRHTVSIVGEASNGEQSNRIHLPFWTDDFDWKTSVMYFPFVDRFADGDTSNNLEFGANWSTGDYLGGDWQGIIDKLDYLADMGVNALWINSPLDNPEGTYDGSCGMTITGYHGYWPQSNTVLEEHFGTEETLRILIDEAHTRGIRVLVDWVGNHTHDEHAWFTEHPNWYTDRHLCTDNDNWNHAPETCWFAPYVPTLDYSNSSAMVQSIDDAMQFAVDYNIDGFRVDAVKHMPKAVHWNLQRQISKHIEHPSNTPFDFYTVGETFSGDRGLLREYVGPELLDGQFDFALYWKILDVFARDNGSLVDLELESQASLDFFEGHTMSNFLGNHDVERFITHAAGEVSSLYGDGLCPTGDWRVDAENPDWDTPYDKLKLAWTWLLTHPGATLIYYGDEIGLPGYHDPDNRQWMQWDWNDRQESVQQLVQTLAIARQEYPQLTSSNRTLWWESEDLIVIALSKEGEHALVVLNRSAQMQSISNGLSWVGLPPSGILLNILTGEERTITDDVQSLTVPSWSAQVWVWK